MSRKSSTRKSSASKTAAIEDSISDDRLTIDKIVQLDPWKDMEKYEAQEAGQIQEILVQFNDMVLKDKRGKRRSVGKNRSPIPSSGDAAVNDERRSRNDEIEQWISATIGNEPENVPIEIASRDRLDAERPVRLDEKKEKFSKATASRVGRRSVGEKRAAASSIKPIAEGQTTEKRNTDTEKFLNWIPMSEGSGSIVDVEKIGTDDKRDKSVGSREEENKDEDKLDGKARRKTISEAEKNVVDTSTGDRQEIRKSVAGLASRNDRSKNAETPQLPTDEPGENSKEESMFACHSTDQSLEILDSVNTIEKSDSAYGNNSKSVLEMAAEDSGILSSTVKSKSAEPEKGTMSENNNNKYESKGAKRREEKMAKAFEKFGRKFVKYSQKVKPSRSRKTGLHDVTEDSESDSESDSDTDESSSSFSDSDESSSSSSSSSSSRCSCCSSSSGSSSYSSGSDSSSASCECSHCHDYYSEYTLASSSSTHPGSDDSTDSFSE